MTLDTLERRIRSLERQNRYLRLIPLMLGILFLGLLVSQAEPNKLPSRPTELFDAEGRKRMVLGMDATGAPHLSLLDSAGQARLRLALTEDGFGVVRVRDSEGRERIALGEVKRESMVLEVSDAASNKTIVLGQLADGRSRLRLGRKAGTVLIEDQAERVGCSVWDTDGRVRAAWGHNPNGTGIEFFDSKGNKRLSSGASVVDGPFLRTFDSNGKARFGVSHVGTEEHAQFYVWDESSIIRLMGGLSTQGHPLLQLTDKDSIKRLRLEVDENNASSMLMMDKDGVPRVAAHVKEFGALALTHPQGKLGFVAGVNNEGAAEAILSDQAGVQRTGLQVREDSVGLFLKNAAGQPRGEFSVHQDGNSRLRLFGLGGKERLRAVAGNSSVTFEMLGALGTVGASLRVDDETNKGTLELQK